MISKSFVVQAFVALTIFAASLTSSVNAAPFTTPGDYLGKAEFVGEASVPTTDTATNEKRFGPGPVIGTQFGRDSSFIEDSNVDYD